LINDDTAQKVTFHVIMFLNRLRKLQRLYILLKVSLSNAYF